MRLSLAQIIGQVIETSRVVRLERVRIVVRGMEGSHASVDIPDALWRALQAQAAAGAAKHAGGAGAHEGSLGEARDRTNERGGAGTDVGWLVNGHHIFCKTRGSLFL